MSLPKIKQKERERLLWIPAILMCLVTLAYFGENILRFRLDLTQGKQYTLSPVTKEILRGLEDKVSVKAVFSRDLPAQFAQIKTHVQDLLEEFESAGGGNFSLSFEDPGLDSIRREAVVREGIQEIQVTEQTREGAVAKRGFFGMTISFGDKREVVPIIENLESFEYDLVVRIKKITGGRKKLGIVEGQGPDQLMFLDPATGGPPAPRTGFKQIFPSLAQETDKLYDIVTVDATRPIPTDIALLVVAAPRRLSEPEKFFIDQYILSGRNALFLTPRTHLDFSRGLNAMPADPGYLDMLKHYGFTLSENIILDEQHGNAFFGNNPFGTPYPFFAAVVGDGLSKESAITATIGGLLIPWTTGLVLDSTEGVRSLALLKSSPKAWEMPPPYDLIPKDPQRGERYLATDRATYTLAGLRVGSFKPFYTQPPEGVDLEGRPQLDSALGPTSIMVVPNMIFATDFFVRWSSQGFGQSSVENISFLLNSFDFLALDQNLIQIRSRQVLRRPISPDGQTHRNFWIMFNLLCAPALLSIVGTVFYIRRKRREGRSVA